MTWTSDDLLTALRLRCRIPDGASVASDAELLTVADDQIATVFTPLIRQVQEEYGVRTTDTALVSGQTDYRIPSRSSAGNLRDVLVVAPGGAAIGLPRVSLEESGRYAEGGSPYWPTGMAFTVIGDKVRILSSGQRTTDTLRLRWYLRPSKLILAAAADAVTTATSSTSIEGSWSAISDGDTVDVIQAVPNFDALTVDDTAGVAGSTLTLTNGADDVADGDYVCPAGQTPIIQLPAELHSVLVTACSITVYEMLRDSEAGSIAAKRLGRELDQVRMLLAPRVDGEESHIINRRGILRGGRRGGWR